MASPLISATKLADKQVRGVVWGFACGAPKAEISEQTGVSEKTSISLILKLRTRLARSTFYRWSAPGDVFLIRQWNDTQEIVNRAVFGVIAMCYFDKRCVSNFRQKRRKKRICRHCMIEALFDDKDAALKTVEMTDVIRDFLPAYWHWRGTLWRSDRNYSITMAAYIGCSACTAAVASEGRCTCI